jgi:hypothetical protein
LYLGVDARKTRIGGSISRAGAGEELEFGIAEELDDPELQA